MTHYTVAGLKTCNPPSSWPHIREHTQYNDQHATSTMVRPRGLSHMTYVETEDRVGHRLIFGAMEAATKHQ